MEQSPILENVNVLEWAKQIHETKIRELSELIEYCENEYNKNKKTSNPIVKCHNRSRINELKKKLEFLINTSNI